MSVPTNVGIDLGLPMTTNRLRLRHVRDSDVGLERTIHSDHSLFAHLPIDPRSVDEAPAVIERRLAARGLDTVGETAMIVFELLEQTEPVGAIQLTPLALDPPRLAIGWLTLAAHHGRGLTTEAVMAIVDHLFVATTTHRIVAEIVEGNEASIRLAQRLGFRREAHFRESLHLRGEWRDEFTYAMLRGDWTRTNMTRRRAGR